jgi:hypothetical protein
VSTINQKHGIRESRILSRVSYVPATCAGWQQDDGQFVAWGDDRDGKEFVKSLSLDVRKPVSYIALWTWMPKNWPVAAIAMRIGDQLGLGIPTTHFSFLAKDSEIRENIQVDWEEGSTNDAIVGRIDKTKETPTGTQDGDKSELQETAAQPHNKNRKIRKPQKLELCGLCPSRLQRLSVVVRVAMYHTTGMLERNVQRVQREEGMDLWHFS